MGFKQHIFWMASAFLIMTPFSQIHALAVQEAKIQQQGTRTILSLVCDRPTTPKVFHLKNPSRIVLDFDRLLWKAPSLRTFMGQGGIKAIRMGNFDTQTTRLVIETYKPVQNFSQLRKHNMLQVAFNGGSGPVMLLSSKSPKIDPPKITTDALVSLPVVPVSRQVTTTITPSVPITNSIPVNVSSKKTIIVLDPGHGGNDPGAVGKTGLKEKTVTLSFAGTLKKEIEKNPAFKVILTRETDDYIPLKKRVEIARDQQANLFISIHADMFPHAPHIRGATVYTLSDKASDEEAGDLARSENKSDLIAGVTLDDQSANVAGILIDLAQRETHEYSLKYASHLVDYIKRSILLTPHPHKEAGFRVLKAPDVPSVLIELGYLSNINDQKNLLDAGWRKRLASSIATSIHRFFVK